jgi:hypothetical protein
MSWAKHQGNATLKSNSSVISDRPGPGLRALIDQATTDSVDESDEHAGLLGMIREEVACPFPARVGGDEVECLAFEWPRNGYGLNVVCRSRNGEDRIVDIAKLELVDPLPEGHEWIEAYLAWRELVV